MSDALMNAIERVPADLEQTMTGFKVRDQSQSDYFDNWVQTLQKYNTDGSQVTLKVLFYDEMQYFNQRSDLKPLTSRTFTLQILSEPCLTNQISIDPSIQQFYLLAETEQQTNYPWQAI